MSNIDWDKLNDKLAEIIKKTEVRETTRKEVIRSSINYIYALLELGFRRDQIKTMFIEDSGIVMSYSAFSSYIKELKKDVNKKEVERLLANHKTKVRIRNSSETPSRETKVEENSFESEKIISKLIVVDNSTSNLTNRLILGKNFKNAIIKHNFIKASTLPLFIKDNALRLGIRNGLREGMTIKQMHEYLTMYFKKEGEESSFIWSIASFRRYVADEKLSRRHNRKTK